MTTDTIITLLKNCSLSVSCDGIVEISFSTTEQSDELIRAIKELQRDATDPAVIEEVKVAFAENINASRRLRKATELLPHAIRDALLHELRESTRSEP